MSFEKPADDMHLFIIDDEGIVFSEEQQSLYSLNTSAAFIWCQLEAGLSLNQLVSEFCKTFSCEYNSAKQQIDDTIKQWQKLGLLPDLKRSIQITSKQEKVPIETVRAPDLPPYVEPTVLYEHDYSLLDSLIRIRYTSDEQRYWVHPVFSHLESETIDTPDFIIDIIGQNSSYYIYRNREPMVLVNDIRALAPSVKGLTIQAAVNSYDYFLYIHAGVLAKNKNILLFPGMSGSGKSTLAAALIRNGFKYLSDEIALMEDSTFYIRPIPVSLCVKSTAWRLLDDLYRILNLLPIHYREDGKRVRYLQPSQSDIVTKSCLPVSIIIFPKYLEGAKTELSGISKVAALKRIMDNCDVLPKRLSVKNVKKLIKWIEGIKCYELTMSSLEEAVDLIRSIELREVHR